MQLAISGLFSYSQESGLSEWLAHLLTAKGSTSLTGLTIAASIAACGVTNVMSNIATANILLPALACVGPKHGLSSLAVMAPVALCISLALLFPIGTPPNAIVLANKNVSLSQMLRVGAICTVVYLTTILVYCLYFLPYLYDLDDVPQSVRDSCGV